MATSHHRRRWLVIGVAMTQVVTACGGGDSDTAPTTIATSSDSPTAPEPAEPATTDLPPATSPAAPTIDAVRLAVTDAAPFDLVDLVGVSTDMVDTLELVVHAADGTHPLPIYDGERGPHISVPPFPADPMTGGTLTLSARSGDDEGSLFELDIAALTPAPGAWDALVEQVDAYFAASAATLGVSLDELAEMPADELSPVAAMLRLMHAMLTEGTEATVDDEDPDVRDAVIAAMGLVDLFAEPLDLSDLDVVATASTSPALGWARQAPGCSPSPVTVTNGRDLAAKIQAGRDAVIHEAGAENRVLQGLGTFLTVASFTPVVGWTAGALAAFFSGLRLFKNAKAGSYPTEITKLSADVDLTSFHEDAFIPGRWSGVTATAASTGWDGLPDVVDLTMAVLGVFASVIAGLPPIEANLLEGFLVDAVSFFRSSAANAIAAEFGTNVIGVCPKTWDVDVTIGPWTDTYAINDRFEINLDQRTYLPLEGHTHAPFTDTLRIRLNAEQFDGLTAWTDHPLEVSAIEVVGPDFISVNNPGDDVPLQITVGPAWDLDVDWMPEKGHWKGNASPSAGPPSSVIWSRTHVSARSENDYPYAVRITSTSSTGLRQDGQPPREMKVNIQLAPFIVTPNPASLNVGDKLAFTATSKDGKPIDARWRVTGGSVDPGPASSTVFSAGNKSGHFTLTVTFGQQVVHVPITILDEECIIGNWELDVPKFVATMNEFADDGSVSYISGDSQVVISKDKTALWKMNDVTLRLNQDGQTHTLIWNSTTINGYDIVDGMYVGDGGQATFDMHIVEFGQGYSMTTDSAAGGTAPFECTRRESLIIHGEDGTIYLTYNGPP